MSRVGVFRSGEEFGFFRRQIIPLFAGYLARTAAGTVNKRDIPACAYHCPTGALTYGNREELLAKARARLNAIRGQYPHASIYGDTQFGGLRVITILKEHPEKYGLPMQPKPVDAEKSEAIRDTYHLLSLFTFGLPSLKRVAYRISKSLVG